MAILRAHLAASSSSASSATTLLTKPVRKAAYLISLSESSLAQIIGDDIEKGPARVGSFVLASLGMAFLGAASAVPEFNKQK